MIHITLLFSFTIIQTSLAYFPFSQDERLATSIKPLECTFKTPTPWNGNTVLVYLHWGRQTGDNQIVGFWEIRYVVSIANLWIYGNDLVVFW